MDFQHDLKIPKSRIPVLIGTKGEVKKELEDISKCSLDVDSKEGDVKIKGSDSLKIYMMRDVITAIGRGFNPEIAKLLLKQDFVLEIMSLLDYVKNKNHIDRVKGRVIGAKGKSRETIEKLTATNISVYGKTIAIIGFAEHVIIAKKAVESLLLGSPHANVYKFLEKSRVKTKQKEMLDW